MAYSMYVAFSESEMGVMAGITKKADVIIWDTQVFPLTTDGADQFMRWLISKKITPGKQVITGFTPEQLLQKIASFLGPMADFIKLPDKTIDLWDFYFILANRQIAPMIQRGDEAAFYTGLGIGVPGPAVKDKLSAIDVAAKYIEAVFAEIATKEEPAAGSLISEDAGEEDE